MPRRTSVSSHYRKNDTAFDGRSRPYQKDGEPRRTPYRDRRDTPPRRRFATDAPPTFEGGARPYDKDREPRRTPYRDRRDAPPRRRFGTDAPAAFESKARSYDKDREPRRTSYRDRRDAPPRRRFATDAPAAFEGKEHSYDKDREPRRTPYRDRRDAPPRRRFGTDAPEGKERSYDKDRETRRTPYRDRRDAPPKSPPAPQTPSDVVRLNKFIANSGICSRREADQYIVNGEISVNGEVVAELGTKISPTDIVKFHDQRLSGEKKRYLLLNKPKGYITTSDDPQERKTVMELVENACPERIYPVGRLDRNTTGVLLFTNDGELTTQLTHPAYSKKKIYHVCLDKNVSKEDLHQLVNGIPLEDGEAAADSASYVDEPNDRTQVGIDIHSGRNRIVRRMFEAMGYEVKRLDRVYFAGLTKKSLERGKWRMLTPQEVSMLKMGAYE